MLERTRVDQGTWSETLYLHTPEGLGDLLTQDQTGQVNHLYQDAQGSTRLVTDKQGSTQSTFDYDAFGNPLLSNKPNDTIKHRYMGEYLDHDIGIYHLRARDYDPKIGRFMNRDNFEGNQRLALSLNPYLYANADPVNGVDPSGYHTLLDTSLTADIAMPAPPVILGSRAIEQALLGVAKIGGIISISNFIDQCIKTGGENCRLGNVLFIGSDYKEAQKHILDAQTGYGSNGFPISPVISYLKGGHGNRNWLRSTWECRYNYSSGNKKVNHGNTIRECDEYPFHASYEGGGCKL